MRGWAGEKEEGGEHASSPGWICIAGECVCEFLDDVYEFPLILQQACAQCGSTSERGMNFG